MKPLFSAPKPPASDAACTCGSGKSFGQCCQPVLANIAAAPSAEALMRARFTAHVIGDSEFLHKSYLADSKKPYNGEQLAGGDRWTRLVIHSQEEGQTPDKAYVEFTAFFKEQGVEVPHIEKAEFVRHEGSWIYNKAVRLGPAPVRNASPKVGRNDPCPCGSGKKYKQCCGKA